jgi:hypothetical protein
MVTCADMVVQVSYPPLESHVTRHMSHVTRHTSHVTRHMSHVTRYTSNVACHTSRSLADYVIRSPYLEGVRKSSVLQVTFDRQLLTMHNVTCDV